MDERRVERLDLGDYVRAGSQALAPCRTQAGWEIEIEGIAVPRSDMPKRVMMVEMRRAKLRVPFVMIENEARLIG